MIDELQEWWAAVVRRIFEFFNGIIQGIQDAIEGVLEWFRDFFVGAWDNYLKPWLDELWFYVKDTSVTALDLLLETSGIVGWLESNISNFEGAMSTILSLNSILPITEGLSAVGVLLGASILIFPIRIIIKVVRG